MTSKQQNLFMPKKAKPKPFKVYEHTIERDICDAVTRNNHFVVKLRDRVKKKDGVYRKTSAYEITGVPDLVIFIAGGITLWAEVKTPSGVLARDQIEFRETITKLGHYHAVVRSVGDTMTAIGRAKKAEQARREGTVDQYPLVDV